MDVSVVVRTKDEGEFIGETLKKVKEQEFDGKFEIVIVDSGSTDSTLDIIKEYDVRLVEISQKDFTYGSSLNIGASHSNGQFVINLSAHALPRDERWLKNLIRGFQNQNVAGVYGRQLSIGDINPFDARQSDLFFGPKRLIFNMKNTKMLKQVHFSNSNSAIRKDMWRRFRFDEKIPYAEDILWQRDVIEAGYSIVYAPDAAVYHTHRVSIRDQYRNSRKCAYALALMRQKRQAFLPIILDIGILMGSVPHSIIQNIRYMWWNNHLEYVKVAPLFILSGWFGWLMGRIDYRLQK
jgi:rhamnosyltransferase